MRIRTPLDVADALASPFGRAELGAPSEPPVIVVDARHDARSLAGLRELPVVSIAWGGEPDGVDVVVDDAAAAEAVHDAVVANPLASVTLVQLLRLHASLGPLDGLVAESLAYATLQGGTEFGAWLAGRGARVRPPDTEPVVLLDRDGDTVRATFNRPRLHNLYNAAMRDALVEVCSLVLADPSARLELHGSGRSFCAGGDLGEFGSMRDTARAHVIRSTANAAPYLYAIAPRTHAFLHGACIGAGIELAAFASRVTAAPDTVIALPEVGMGLIPGAGGTVSITRRIGHRRTAWLALTGARIDATTALAWGLVDAITG